MKDMNKKTEDRKYWVWWAVLIAVIAIIVYVYRDFLNKNSDALMVVITAVYVVATIFICRANNKSAEASRAQLEEMRRQYADANRPFIAVEFTLATRGCYVLRLVNNGRLTALNVRVRLNEDFIESIDFKEIKEILRSQRDKMCIIGAGQHFDIPVGGYDLRDNPNLKPLRGMVTYEGGGYRYETEIDIDIENYMTIFRFSE
ncbi:MAG: hypothetical protein J6A79_01395 [Clostridia bacterium]|nr:hypothetical protein [Clostridia bacterium]